MFFFFLIYCDLSFKTNYHKTLKYYVYLYVVPITLFKLYLFRIIFKANYFVKKFGFVASFFFLFIYLKEIILLNVRLLFVKLSRQVE